ncbi:15-hydroxyprostaglandin dehydrogenase [NAD(+)]-like [Leptinotarsa decemlineata]|uniref:15-hydroxyprostaglandin dehydrogenase [NAD(+)]-like n=1 Tax=Leptinotarsa decemlineata TaxID=7539 RepID=UPI003D306324
MKQTNDFSSKMDFLRKKVALVTGGASGIGLSVIRKFLENGVKGVAIVDVSENNTVEILSSLQEDYKDRIIFIKADVTKGNELRDAFEKAIEKFKNLDIVFNNAGIVNEVDWEKMLAVNLAAVMRGTFLAIREYLPKYKSSEEGVVLNTASILGINTIPNGVSYCTAKHGVVGLGKALRENESCKRHGIRVLTICPGVVNTGLLSAIVSENVEKLVEDLSVLCKLASSPDYIADCVLKIIDKGEHGSIWVAEDEEAPYEVVFPNRRELRKIE